jgi:hypothetical protein
MGSYVFILFHTSIKVTPCTGIDIVIDIGNSSTTRFLASCPSLRSFATLNATTLPRFDLGSGFGFVHDCMCLYYF